MRVFKSILKCIGVGLLILFITVICSELFVFRPRCERCNIMMVKSSINLHNESDGIIIWECPKCEILTSERIK
jgi:hypothetical protein